MLRRIQIATAGLAAAAAFAVGPVAGQASASEFRAVPGIFGTTQTQNAPAAREISTCTEIIVGVCGGAAGGLAQACVQQIIDMCNKPNQSADPND